MAALGSKRSPELGTNTPECVLVGGSDSPPPLWRPRKIGLTLFELASQNHRVGLGVKSNSPMKPDLRCIFGLFLFTTTQLDVFLGLLA